MNTTTTNRRRRAHRRLKLTHVVVGDHDPEPLAKPRVRYIEHARITYPPLDNRALDAHRRATATRLEVNGLRPDAASEARRLD